MDRQYKLLVASSLVAIMATGCSSFGSRGNTDPQTTVGGGSYAGGQQVSGSGSNYGGQQSSPAVVTEPAPVTCGQCAVNQTAAVNNNGRTQQWYVDQWNRQQAGKQTPAVNNGRTQQWYIDQYNRSQAAAKAKATTTTSNGRSQQWYIDQYNRSQAAAKAKAAAAATTTTTNGRSKQWYVDQWNRQQAAAKKPAAYVPPKPVVVTPPKPAYVAPTYVAPAYVPPKPVVAVKPYVAPAPAPKTTTQYIDYTNGAAATAVAPSNKSLYTGSYQQPRQAYTTYTPKTYTGGANTSSATSYGGGSTPAATGGTTYTVQKGDTVFAVMRQTGVYWKEIISLNNLQGPSYTIQPGQQLRLK